MLSESEKHEILEEIKLYPYPNAACIEALKVVQHHRGWVDDKSVKDIAEILGMSADEVDGVATFYSRIYRKPVGRHVILLCDSISCMVMGYNSIYYHISEKLGIQFGETTSDGRFTLLPISCLGNCDFAPSMMIDYQLYNKLNIETIDEIIEKYA